MGSELLALLEKEAAAERDRVLAEARAQAEEIRAAAEGQARQVVEAQRQQQEGWGIRRTLAQQDANWQPEVRSAADVRGGVRLASPDGRYVVLNTLASRLERARPTLASEVARTLWR